jgi:photosystem II stability/assembly factor-like uncharacterized protein
VNPVDPKVVLLSQLQLYRSTDGGNTWNVPSAPAPVERPRYVAFSRDGTVAWAGTHLGQVYRSLNAGTSWELRSTGLPAAPSSPVEEIDVDAISNAIAYARIGGVVYRTIDGGGTWTALPGRDTYWGLAASPTTPGVLIGIRPEYPFRTLDYGDTWRQSTLPGFSLIEYAPGTAGRAIGVLQGDRVRLTTDDALFWFGGGRLGIAAVQDLSIHPSNHDRVLMGTSLGVLASQDSASTWSERTHGIAEATTGQFAVASDGSGVIYASVYDPEQIYRRDPHTGQWQGVARGAREVYGTAGPLRYSIATAPGSSRVLYMSRNQRFGRSDDGGVTWMQLGSLDAESFSFAPANAQVGYAASLQLGVLKTTDGGAIWDAVNSGLPASIQQVLIDPADPNVLYAGSGTNTPLGLFKSTTAGSFWFATGTGVERVVSKLVFEPGNSSIIYAATDAGLLRSVNSGNTWSVIYGPAHGARAVADVAIDPATPAIIYACANPASASARSVNGGETWEPLQLPSIGPDADCTGLTLVPHQPTVIVGSRRGAGMFEMEVAPDLSVVSRQSPLAIGRSPAHRRGACRRSRSSCARAPGSAGR